MRLESTGLLTQSDAEHDRAAVRGMRPAMVVFRHTSCQKGHYPVDQQLHFCALVLLAEFFEDTRSDDASPILQVLDTLDLETDMWVVPHGGQLLTRNGMAVDASVAVGVHDRHDVWPAIADAADTADDRFAQHVFDLRSVEFSKHASTVGSSPAIEKDRRSTAFGYLVLDKSHASPGRVVYTMRRDDE